MKLRMKVPVQAEPRGKWLPVGSVLEVEHDEAMKLIARNQAAVVDNGEPFPSDDGGPASSLSPEAMDAAIEELTQVKGINKRNVKAVIAAGYTDIAELQTATVAQLAAISGIKAKQAAVVAKDAAEFEITEE